MRHDLIREDIEAAEVAELIRTGRDDLILAELVATVAEYATRYEGEPSVNDVTEALAGWPMAVKYYNAAGVEVTSGDSWAYMQETRS
jgi:hypothetical protein